MIEWRPVVGWEGIYDVSDSGDVRRMVSRTSTKAGRILKSLIRFGYRTTTLYRPGERQRIVRNARLVAAAFIGAPPTERPEINHKDGNKLNDDWHNLEWTSRLENAQHAARTGLYPRGARNHSTKLNEDEVRALRTLHRWCGWSVKKLASAFGLSLGGVEGILRGRSWKYLT